MPPIYLSSQTPRWTPRNEQDLRQAIDGGLIEESHHLDAKRDVTTKGDRRELARDLSSFAVDGGTLIIGIEEDKASRTFSLAPQPLNGLAERVDQVARSIPDPPLNVITEEIPTGTDNTSGYLLVHVPISPQAPHMVEGVYQGRNDKTKIRLTDAEVARLHRLRRSADQDALALLEREIEQDPLRNIGEQSHLFLVAEPLTSSRNMLMGLTGGPGWNENLSKFITQAYEHDLSFLLRNFRANPEITDASKGYRIAGGAAKATFNLAPGRVHAAEPGSYGAEDALELQVLENGGLRMFSSHMSDIVSRDDDQQWIFDTSVVSLTRRFIALTLAAAEIGGYTGNWAIALGLTKLRGRGPQSLQPGAFQFGSSARYSHDDYRETTGTTWAEINTNPGALTHRLVGPFLRALDVEPRYSAVLTDPDSAAPNS